jgi:hypothetical protein
MTVIERLQDLCHSTLGQHHLIAGAEVRERLAANTVWRAYLDHAVRGITAGDQPSDVQSNIY